ncbi:MAG: cytochrome c [Halofilum sp. (in: g-proteobacteria)]|nr:cytochrome c [Halofilum sp. (in: g-proteobacteria)]
MRSRRQIPGRACALALLAGIALGPAVPAAAGEPPEPVGPHLPERVRGLLLQEMNAILDASQEILAALVRGQHQRVAEQAQAIHDSFILKQQMTDADRQALMAAVPAGFVDRDRAFHRLTGRLAQAAREGEAARQRALFDRMIEACTACHRRYAHDRFPGLRRD